MPLERYLLPYVKERRETTPGWGTRRSKGQKREGRPHARMQKVSEGSLGEVTLRQESMVGPCSSS